MQKGEIYLANFDPLDEKVKPVLVLQAESTINKRVIVVPISSRKQKSKIIIWPDRKNRMFKPGYVQIDQVTSILKENLFCYLGYLNDAYISSLNYQLIKYFDFLW